MITAFWLVLFLVISTVLLQQCCNDNWVKIYDLAENKSICNRLEKTNTHFNIHSLWNYTVEILLTNDTNNVSYTTV